MVFYILIWLKITILCIFFVRTLPYWHRCINSTVNSNHSIIVLQEAASCLILLPKEEQVSVRWRGVRDGAGGWTFENDAVSRCSGLCNFVPLTQRTQKQPFSKRKVRPLPNTSENPSLVDGLPLGFWGFGFSSLRGTFISGSARSLTWKCVS